MWCGGPEQPIGPPALVVELELETRPESNGRDRFSRSARTQAARDAIIAEISVALAQGQALPPGPWCVRMTRLTPNKLLDVGNLWSALKSVEDTIAFVLQANDGSAAWGAMVAQEARKGPLGVRVEIWGGEAAP